MPTHALNSNFVMYAGDTSTTFLHASDIQPRFVSPAEDYQSISKQRVVWRLQKGHVRAEVSA